MLIKHLVNTEEPRVLAVACYDLGEFVRFHPRGKQCVVVRPFHLNLCLNRSAHA